MSSESVCASDHRRWQALGLQDYEKFSDKTTDRNQVDCGDHSEGLWFYVQESPLPDGSYVIYYGSWGNYNSPGADNYTHAELYDTQEEQRHDAAEWQARPEWEKVEEDDTEDDEDEEDDDETNEE
jgi:hypothetical protein